jgi:hypothetical protein
MGMRRGMIIMRGRGIRMVIKSAIRSGRGVGIECRSGRGIRYE